MITKQVIFFEGLHAGDVVNNAHISHTHAEGEFGGSGTVELAEDVLDVLNILFGRLYVNFLRVFTVIWAAIIDSDELA
jgi:hypothetical protein